MNRDLRNVSRRSFRSRRRLWVAFVAVACAAVSGCALLGPSEAPISEVHEKSLRAYAQKDYRAAALYLEEVVERVPSDSESWFRLGNAYSRTNRPRQAVAAYQQAVLKDSSHDRAWYNLGIVQTRIAANSFLEMSEHLDAGNPLRGVALDMADALLETLEERSRPGAADAPDPPASEAGSERP